MITHKAISWLFFWIGHALSKTFYWGNCGDMCTPITYPLYNWLMIKSGDISDRHNLGIWKHPQENSREHDIHWQLELGGKCGPLRN